MFKTIFLVCLLMVSLSAQAELACTEQFGRGMKQYVEGDTVRQDVTADEIKLLNAVVSDYKRCCKGKAGCYNQSSVDAYAIPKTIFSTAPSRGVARKTITCEEVAPGISVQCGGATYLHETKGVLSCETQKRLKQATPVDDQGMGLESGAVN